MKRDKVPPLVSFQCYLCAILVLQLVPFSYFLPLPPDILNPPLGRSDIKKNLISSCLVLSYCTDRIVSYRIITVYEVDSL